MKDKEPESLAIFPMPCHNKESLSYEVTVLLSFRMIFGVICLSAALVLLLYLGYKRFRRWLVHQRRPDLRQRSGAAHYTGSFRLKNRRSALPFSGLGSYKGSRRRSYTRQKPLFHTTSYKGRKFPRRK